MPFFRVMTDEGKSWVLEWSGIGKLFEFVAEFEDAERAKRYVEFENAQEGDIEGELATLAKPAKSKVSEKPRRGRPPKATTVVAPMQRMTAVPPKSVGGAGNEIITVADRAAFRERATQRLMSAMAQMADTRGCIEISYQDLARVCGISAGSTQRYLQSLVESGAINLARPGMGNGKASIYQLPPDLIEIERSKSATLINGTRE